MSIHAFAALQARGRLEPFEYEPLPLGAHDVEIKITHCGLCHTDLHYNQTLAKAKGMRWPQVFACFVEAGNTVTPILLLLCAVMYTKLLALEGAPDAVKGLLDGMGLGREGSLLFMAVVWFVLGCVIDSISIMLLTVPIFWPVAAAFGFDPIVFALIGILVIEAGVLTPPCGIGCFVVKAAVPGRGIQLREIFWGATPYWIMILIVAWLIYYWPPLANWLPSKV